MKFYLLLILFVIHVKCQSFIRSSPLDIFTKQYQEIKDIIFAGVGRSSEDQINISKARAANLLQKQIPLSEKFPCNVTGFRSVVSPSNVNRVRPGDIDVIAAIGDSVTTGSGLAATNVLQVMADNRGLAFNIGGQGTWREYLTLPNILKEFNPNLIGYSVGDSYTNYRDSQFNIAEFAGFSSELPQMTRVLLQRMRADSRVDIKNHWKLITLLVGINNFCLDMCFQNNPEDILIYHRNDLLSVFRMLKKNLPKTIINIVPPPDVGLIRYLVEHKPLYCRLLNMYECMCYLLPKYASQADRYDTVVKKWQQLEEEIANMDEFNTDDFAILYQPFSLNFRYPRTGDNKLDLTYLSKDCYHMNQKTSAEAANSLWNNMLERNGNKTTKNERAFQRFLCPSEKEPYIFTKNNSN